MDIPDLVTVYTVSNSIAAEIIKNALQADGIRCFIEGENQAAEAGLMSIEIKIQVPVDQADQARKLIAAHDGPHHGRSQSFTKQPNQADKNTGRKP